MALCVAAYGLLVSERSLIPPQTIKPCSSRRLAYPRVIDPVDPPIEQNAMSKRQSQASALDWPEVSPGDCLLPKSRAVQFSAIWSILRISLISRAARQRALRTFWHPAILIML